MDMDAFFASVEQRDNPLLKGKPIAVGGTSNRSVVATASYEARKLGIHSAMPMFQALERCPNLIVVKPDKKKYRNISLAIMELLTEYTPCVEPVSIDEAFLDVTGCNRISGNPETIAQSIKIRMVDRFDLTCSLGVAPLKFLAKIASDMNKPNGITIIHEQDTQAFINGLAINKIPGVGKNAMGKMKLLGIETLGDVRRLNTELLMGKFGKFGLRLAELSRGIDRSQVVVEEKRKSISSESTLDMDITDGERIKKELLGHAQIVGHDLRQRGLFAATIFIKFKFSDFSQMTRQVKVDPPICASSAIYETAVTLAENFNIEKPIRLIGLGGSSLTKTRPSSQMDLFQTMDPPSDKWEKVDKTVDAITKKFGHGIVTKASLNE
jgi:DNA polymerase-4